ncbi:MAG: hypothetical protein ACREP9_11720, partial [Candidatus Dormibacteraceae bacterium]
WVHGLKSMATIGCRYRDTIIHALRVAAPGHREDGRTRNYVAYPAVSSVRSPTRHLPAPSMHQGLTIFGNASC